MPTEAATRKRMSTKEGRNAVESRILAHPLRRTILTRIVESEKPISPSDLASSLEQPLGNVSYHIRELATAKLVTLKRKTPRRGALEHFYTSTDRGKAVAAFVASWPE